MFLHLFLSTNCLQDLLGGFKVRCPLRGGIEPHGLPGIHLGTLLVVTTWDSLAFWCPMSEKHKHPTIHTTAYHDKELTTPKYQGQGSRALK